MVSATKNQYLVNLITKRTLQFMRNIFPTHFNLRSSPNGIIRGQCFLLTIKIHKCVLSLYIIKINSINWTHKSLYLQKWREWESCGLGQANKEKFDTGGSREERFVGNLFTIKLELNKTKMSQFLFCLLLTVQCQVQTLEAKKWFYCSGFSELKTSVPRV